MVGHGLRWARVMSVGPLRGPVLEAPGLQELALSRLSTAAREPIGLY
jgi:hypothetical protein